MNESGLFKLVEARGRSFAIDGILLPGIVSVPLFVLGEAIKVVGGPPTLSTSLAILISSLVFVWIAIDEARSGSSLSKRLNRIQIVAQAPNGRLMRAALKWGLLFVPGLVASVTELFHIQASYMFDLSLGLLPTAWIGALFLNVFCAEQHGGWFDRLCGTRVTPIGVDPWQQRGFDIIP